VDFHPTSKYLVCLCSVEYKCVGGCFSVGLGPFEDSTLYRSVVFLCLGCLPCVRAQVREFNIQMSRLTLPTVMIDFLFMGISTFQDSVKIRKTLCKCGVGSQLVTQIRTYHSKTVLNLAFGEVGLYFMFSTQLYYLV